MTDAETLTGGCLCGAVRFDYDGPLGGDVGAVTVCHCAQCRKAQGYASAVAPALAAAFRLIAGADRIREFESSPGKKRAFCADCGSPIYSRLDARPEVLRLRLGTLDDPPATLVVQAHTFTEALPAWSVPNDAPRYPAREPGRT